MADTVQYHLERMLPELEDLQSRKLFSRSEIKEIVKRRRDFEYLLKRHSPLKEDYLRYVEYEKQLESLRLLRKKAILRDLRKNGERWRKSLCDKTSVQHIWLIFERAVMRFKGDLSIWLQYLEYCRSQGSRRIQKVMTRALQLHPSAPGLWIYAAAWEFEHNSNVNAARALLQRGLRMCPRADNLWLEYLRMELVYVGKLKARRLLLRGLDALSIKRKQESTVESSVNVNENGIADGVAETAIYGARMGSASGLEDQLSHKLTLAVFRNSIAAIGLDADFRHRFLEILDSFDFEHKTDVEEQIFASIANDFPTDEGCWDWQARREIAKVQNKDDVPSVVEARKKAILVYETSLKTIPSGRMYELYAKFLMELVDTHIVLSKAEACIGLEAGEVSGDMLANKLLQVYSRAEAAGCLTNGIAEVQLYLLLKWGRSGEARKFAKEFCNKLDSKPCATMWKQWIGLEMQRLQLSNSGDSESVFHLFEKALKVIPLSEAKQLWLMGLELFSGYAGYLDLLLVSLERVLAGGAGGERAAELACAAVKCVLHSQGIKQAQGVYNRFLALPGPSLQLLKLCITIETRNRDTGDVQAFSSMRKLFSQATALYGDKDTDLWLEYFKAEIKAGNVDAASHVYWCAKKKLKDPTSFIERHQLL